ncbi:SRPBCC family protein [Streptomyces sp. PG2]
MPHSYRVTSHSHATPGAVFSLLVRGGTWSSWSPIDTVGIEGGGDPDAPQKVGDTRVFRTGRATSREPIVELVADRRFGYENLGGPFRSYRGVIELVEAPGAVPTSPGRRPSCRRFPSRVASCGGTSPATCSGWPTDWRGTPADPTSDRVVRRVVRRAV